MEWLLQNWIWLALGVGTVFMMRGGGAGGRCCGNYGDVSDLARRRLKSMKHHLRLVHSFWQQVQLAF